ncbi:hypothetical protein AGMMS50255_0600 [Spirochaetia bacterium]|nr:hypothetical protein AGMMS50255_0600 [Spirochaetia bacterium]
MKESLRKKTADMPFLVKLFCSFILLASIPVICISIFHHMMLINFYKNELGKSYIENLKVADTIFKMWDDETKKQALIISLNEHLKRLESDKETYTGPMDYNYLSQMMQFSYDLENIVSTNRKYQSISVIYEEGGKIITSDHGVIPLSEENGYTMESYRELYAQGSRWLTTHAMPAGAGNSPGENVLTYVTPLMPYVTRAAGLIVFNLKESELSSIINGGPEKPASNIFIMDADGMILSDTNKGNIRKNGTAALPAIREILDSPSFSGVFTNKIEGRNFFSIYWKSGLNGWYYCSFVPMDELNVRVNAVFMLTLALMAAFLILAVPLSYILAKRLNTPMEKFSQRLKKDEELISEYYLLQLLSGAYGKESGGPQAQNPFAAPNFRCVIIHLDRYSQLTEKYELKQINEYKQELLKTCLERLSALSFCNGLIPDKSDMAVLLNFDRLDTNRLQRTLEDIQRYTREKFFFSVSIGIGGITKLEEVHLSYNTAQRALSRRLMLGDGSILFYTEQMEVLKGYFYPYDQEKIIFNNLHLNAMDKTLHALEGFFAEIRNRKNISIDNTTQAFNQLAGSIIKYLVDLRINSREIFDDELNLYHRLIEFEFIDEIQEFFSGVLQKIILFQMKEDVQKTPVKKILDYINANYNQKFDLNDLSNHIGLSYSHVRRVFTEEMGESILNYVYKTKVEASKKLLLETDVHISDISDRLGFYNKQSFYRFFKKFEGVTPNEFREVEQRIQVYS